jgi:hypothetical protein
MFKSSVCPKHDGINTALTVGRCEENCINCLRIFSPYDAMNAASGEGIRLRAEQFGHRSTSFSCSWSNWFSATKRGVEMYLYIVLMLQHFA